MNFPTRFILVAAPIAMYLVVHQLMWVSIFDRSLYNRHETLDEVFSWLISIPFTALACLAILAIFSVLAWLLTGKWPDFDKPFW